MTTKHDSTPSILVIGGTGVVGAPIVEQLALAGWRVRVACRHPEKAEGRFGGSVELVKADANRWEDLAAALTGCDAALICVSDLLDPYLDLRVTRTVVELAQELGVRRVGLVSGPSVAEERRYFPMIDAKFQAEEHLKASDLEWIIIRPTWPMESLARFAQPKGATILGKQSAVIHPIAGADIGRSVARAFDLPEAAGHTFTLHGPEAATMEQWLTDYSSRVHPGAPVKHAPLRLLGLIAFVTRNRMLKAAVALMRYFEPLPELGDPSEANAVLGEATTTLEEWVAQRGEAATAERQNGYTPDPRSRSTARRSRTPLAAPQRS